MRFPESSAYWHVLLAGLPRGALAAGTFFVGLRGGVGAAIRFFRKRSLPLYCGPGKEVHCDACLKGTRRPFAWPHWPS